MVFGNAQQFYEYSAPQLLLLVETAVLLKGVAWAELFGRMTTLGLEESSKFIVVNCKRNQALSISPLLEIN